jgi:diguanylate cyclase (GGDEF)-like protein/PAS domain S-box-containing protein
VLGLLPRGSTLPDAVWERRHRIMLLVVAVQLVGLTTAGVVLGLAPQRLAYLLGPIVLCALAAAEPTASRRWRGSMLSFAALYCAAALVDLTDGATEAHFGFFVMVAMLAIYEEWVPYLLAIAFVAIHHVVLGTVAPGTIYDHGSAVLSPWTWALVHTGFILALCIVTIASWRLSEESRAAVAEALERTRRSEEEFRGAFDDAPTGVAFVGLDGRFRRVNRSLCTLTGFTEADFETMPLEDGPDGTPGLFVDRHPGDAVAFEGPFRRADGGTGWGLARRSTIHDAAGVPTHRILQLLDLTARRRAEEDLAHAATHDPLTGLPNRKHFERAATEALERLADGESVALLFIDIDDFKVINDSLGHGAGDRLLLVIAQRLRALVHEPDVLARFGGDEFIVLLANAGVAEATAMADAVHEVLRMPADLDGERRFVTASVGVTLSDRSPSSAGAMIRDGDAAMYRAKATGKDRHVLFDEALRGAVVRRLELEGGLRQALGDGELELHYQPEFDLGRRTVIGVEALLRWRRRDGTLVEPGEFIPIAERSGLIIPIGRFVFDEAIRQAAAWAEAGGPFAGLLTSVNLSARQLTEPGLVPDVLAAIQRHGVAPASICLEITETAVMSDPDLAIRTLREIKAAGFLIAIDDFGTGHSSLANLGRLLPVDILKIDRSFVHDIGRSREADAIVTAVIDLGRRLGLTVIAEGIEDLAQAALVQRLGCAIGQGYALGAPQPADAIAALLTGDAADRAA